LIQFVKSQYKSNRKNKSMELILKAFRQIVSQRNMNKFQRLIEMRSVGNAQYPINFMQRSQVPWSRQLNALKNFNEQLRDDSNCYLGFVKRLSPLFRAAESEAQSSASEFDASNPLADFDSSGQVLGKESLKSFYHPSLQAEDFQLKQVKKYLFEQLVKNAMDSQIF